MKIQFTLLNLKKIKLIVMMACLSLLSSQQLFAQHHRNHFWGNDSIFVWNDSGRAWHDSGHTWNDSGRAWHDTIHFPPPPQDSGHVWNDSGHTWNDSGHAWHDTIHFPPPPQDSGHVWNDSGYSWNDSGHAWHDTMHFPPPPQDSGHVWNDSGHTWNDSFPPPPPQDSGNAWNDTGHCPPPPHHGGRYADSVNPSSTVSVYIYPNPIVESAVLHIENTSGNVTFRMYGVNGKLVMEKELTNGDFQLNKTNLGAGVYFYEINDGNTSVSKGKLIFQ